MAYRNRKPIFKIILFGRTWITQSINNTKLRLIFLILFEFPLVNKSEVFS